jgi:lipopolysaccharide/colanic/teichoic acid biosynthesis glycosyltransferase
MKRAIDIVFSGIALLVFAIPAICIACILTWKEKHPVFFKQQRVGKNKRAFEILKFQTMVNHIPTPTGYFLRRTGLDEIPQFINVLRGDMHIVGPRALTKFDIERLGWDDPYYSVRWNVRPGITGMAQLYGGQHKKTSWFWDLHYIKKNDSFIDITIIGVSFLMNMVGKTNVRRLIFQKNNLK